MQAALDLIIVIICLHIENIIFNFKMKVCRITLSSSAVTLALGLVLFSQETKRELFILTGVAHRLHIVATLFRAALQIKNTEKVRNWKRD